MTTKELENYEPKGKLEGFPKEIIARMLECQEEQGNKRDVSVFEREIYAGRFFGGFDWDNTKEAKEDWDFWAKVIVRENFDIFFEKYPKQEETKVCSKCHKEKPLSEFHKRVDTVRSECKECNQELKNNKNMKENNKKEDDSQEFRVGDKVYDILLKEVGIVQDIVYSSSYGLSVKFKSGVKSYTINGCYIREYKNPHLLHYRDDYDYDVIDFNNLPKKQEQKRWRAEKGQRYYYIDIFFEVSSFKEGYSNTDTELYNSRNYFQTKKEAQEFADILKKSFIDILFNN